MRSTLEIIIAVQENQPAEDSELRLALLAMSSIDHFLEHDLRRLAELVIADKPFAKVHAELTVGLLEGLFQARKKDPKEWLGPDNIPGTEAYAKRMKLGKKIFKKATGIDLDG